MGRITFRCIQGARSRRRLLGSLGTPAPNLKGVNDQGIDRRRRHRRRNGRQRARGRLRSAGGVFDASAPDVRLVAIADVNDELAEDTRRRYGFVRTEHDWRSIVECRRCRRGERRGGQQPPSSRGHRGVVGSGQACVVRKALGAKRCRCQGPWWRPLSSTTGLPLSAIPIGGRPRSMPSVVNSTRATWARPIHFNGHAWYGYAFDPQVPMTWRYRGGPGSGVLADVGSHLVDTAEMLCGPVVEVSGGSFVTGHRPSGRCPPVPPWAMAGWRRPAKRSSR